MVLQTSMVLQTPSSSLHLQDSWKKSLVIIGADRSPLGTAMMQLHPDSAANDIELDSVYAVDSLWIRCVHGLALGL